MESTFKSEKFWDRAAKNFDKQEKKDRPIFQKSIQKTKNYLKINDIVLDFGCGTGQVSNEIAENVKMVHAIDISTKMIEIAKNKAQLNNIQNIEYINANLFDGKFKPGSMNIILAFYIFHLTDDVRNTLKRIHELLKPGGLIISVTPCMGNMWGLKGLFSLGTRLGIIPKVLLFKITELEKMFIQEDFEIIEKLSLQKNSHQYFIVAKKRTS